MRPASIIVALVLSCALSGASCTESPDPSSETEGAAAVASGDEPSEGATGESASALLDPACVEACEKAWEVRNESCRKIGNARLRGACWAAANAALALCLKLCPDITPCPPD